MNPHQRIESIKSFTPPSAGELYTHPTLGVIILKRPSAGDAWWATKISAPSQQFEIQPSRLRRHYEQDPAP